MSDDDENWAPGMWVGCGCLIFVALAVVLAVVVLILLGAHFVNPFG